ncbi:hypothetical protein ABH898_002639 [Paenibacillus sp. RC82]
MKIGKVSTLRVNAKVDSVGVLKDERLFTA